MAHSRPNSVGVTGVDGRGQPAGTQQPAGQEPLRVSKGCCPLAARLAACQWFLAGWALLHSSPSYLDKDVSGEADALRFWTDQSHAAAEKLSEH